MQQTIKLAGFTLVELAIVLVIVGLLIGGILVGDSLISTQKLQSTIKQIQQYDIAVSNFKTRYNSLPGDSTVFTPAGNGNGWITDSGGGYTLFDSEIANFWVHLDAAGMLKDDKTYTAAGATLTTKGTSANIPAIKLGVNSGALAFGNQSIVLGTQYLIGNYEGHTIASTFAVTGYPTNSLTPAQALAIDTKIDNGIYNTGTVMGAGPGTLSSALNGATCIEDPEEDFTYIYKNTDTVDCLLRIDMLAQTEMQ